ncbi:hypothetical protein BaRGS_00016810 [Batillaria attramentaria]|uniref:Uncharacterized protein n=1 Tax=Batillaria attramentaria TaxID=370345 RepID=A0ABD0KYS5_9CAEN
MPSLVSLPRTNRTSPQQKQKSKFTDNLTCKQNTTPHVCPNRQTNIQSSVDAVQSSTAAVYTRNDHEQRSVAVRDTATPPPPPPWPGPPSARSLLLLEMHKMDRCTYCAGRVLTRWGPVCPTAATTVRHGKANEQPVINMKVFTCNANHGRRG